MIFTVKAGREDEGNHSEIWEVLSFMEEWSNPGCRLHAKTHTIAAKCTKT